ncbi:MAG: hypothetical protein KH413_04930 [Actinomyces sp.]|nr:hypothetical protein [Actinomyces sp.]
MPTGWQVRSGSGDKRLPVRVFSSQGLPDAIARVEPGYVDGYLANVHPAQLLNATAHVRTQVLESGGQGGGEDEAEVQMEDRALPIELACGLGSRPEVSAGANPEDSTCVRADSGKFKRGLSGDSGDDIGRNSRGAALRQGGFLLA